ncbi:hypothetical protein VTK73DRAFT_3624 [Phialemonium thermophilum]|uniref:Major facilitator superfamily (MFS) profile domain-containing protein n=1 Tax=Phialemonium thermophilum TaxID=223376 RepID=A0ABR3VJ29_9PEZI
MARAETDPLPPHDAEQEPKKNPEASNGSTDEGTTNDEPPQDPNKPPNFGAGAPDGGFGWINSVGVFQEYYQSGPLKSYSPSTISWIPSLQIFFMMGMGPVVGKIFDNWGPRHVLAIGSFMHVFGLMMASISSKYYQFLLAQGVCSAIGVAAIFQPSINCIPGWFFKKRGAAYGVVATGSSLGGIIFPIMISRLINQVGYGWALRSAAFLILALVLIANATVRSRLPPRRAARKDANGTVTTQPAAPSVPVWDIVREPGFLALMIGMFLITFGIFVPVTYLQVDAMQAGMRPGLAQYLIAIFNTGR